MLQVLPSCYYKNMKIWLSHLPEQCILQNVKIWRDNSFRVPLLIHYPPLTKVYQRNFLCSRRKRILLFKLKLSWILRKRADIHACADVFPDKNTNIQNIQHAFTGTTFCDCIISFFSFLIFSSFVHFPFSSRGSKKQQTVNISPNKRAWFSGIWKYICTISYSVSIFTLCFALLCFALLCFALLCFALLNLLLWTAYNYTACNKSHIDL